MQKIKLSSGENVLVDDDDFEYLNQWNMKARELFGEYAFLNHE